MIVTRKGQMPQESHWAIIRFSSIHIQGQDPALDEPVTEYHAFTDRGEWETKIAMLSAL